MLLETTSPSDEQLAAEAAREGSDGLAFQTLVERFRQPVWRICYRLMGNEQDAQDAAQEVFVRLFFQRGRFEGRSKFSTWVHGIALRVCLTMRRGRSRRQRRETAAGDAIWAEQPSTSTPRPGLQLDLQQMLDTLDEEDRALLILKYSESYTFEELGEMFDMTTSACKMRVMRAREKLQARFPGEGT
ncbi:MAG: RNA polymerase sigma factor [Pirellulales bacterium]